MIGRLLMSIPYISQVIRPNSSIITIGNEISLVCLVRIALIDWGRYANVVKQAASNPRISVNVSNLLDLQSNVQTGFVCCSCSYLQVRAGRFNFGILVEQLHRHASG